jgi:hypothetical protein
MKSPRSSQVCDIEDLQLIQDMNVMLGTAFSNVSVDPYAQVIPDTYLYVYHEVLLLEI